MNRMNQARIFHSLHTSDEMLVLPNVWDAVSAKIFERAGYQAIGTSSAGIAWSHGYADGERISTDEMIQALARIVRAVKIPVTADIESAFIHNSYVKLEQFLSDVIDTGVVGLTIEDKCEGGAVQCDLEYQMEVITLAKEVGRKKGIDVFVNARTDSMDVVMGNLQTKTEISIRRAHAFIEAGADGIFVPFVKNIETIQALKEHISKPLNVLWNSNLSIADLKSCGVNRLSVGAQPMLATLQKVLDLSHQMKNSDDWSLFESHSLSEKDVNSWFL